MHDLKDILSVLAPFLLGLFTNYLSNKRSTRQEDRDYILKENETLSKENEKLRQENGQLRKELSKYDN